MKKILFFILMVPAALFSQDYSDIRLTSVCSENPVETRRWRVYNPFGMELTVTYSVYGTDQQGSLVIHPVTVNDGYTYFNTVAVPGPNTVKLYHNSQQIDVKASGGQKCSVQDTNIEGDIDGDGLARVYDAYLILAYVNGWKTMDGLPENFLVSAELTGDGQVDMDDFWYLWNVLLNLE